jgi:hypothetical protein
MEMKRRSPTVSLIVASIGFAGLGGCVFLCFSLHRELKTQQGNLSEARQQLLRLEQSLKAQHADLSKAQEQLETNVEKIAKVEQQSQNLHQQLASLQSQPRESKYVAEAQVFAPPPVAFDGPDVPAADSIEGKLKADGKAWESVPGQPVPGEYVQDTMGGRMNQPKGRGNIGKVLAVGNDSGTMCATVDFGRGCTEGIMFRELAPIHFVDPGMR